MSNVCEHGVNFYKRRCLICRPLNPVGRIMQEDIYVCANKKCKHRFKHGELVFVREHRPGPKTLPTSRGTCPKCGHESYYLVKTQQK